MAAKDDFGAKAKSDDKVDTYFVRHDDGSTEWVFVEPGSDPPHGAVLPEADEV